MIGILSDNKCRINFGRHNITSASSNAVNVHNSLKREAMPNDVLYNMLY